MKPPSNSDSCALLRHAAKGALELLDTVEKRASFMKKRYSLCPLWSWPAPCCSWPVRLLPGAVTWSVYY